MTSSSNRSLLETKAVLTKVYGVDSSLVTQKLAQLAAAPIAILPVDGVTTLSSMHTADPLRIDLTDAVLLQAVQAQGATWLTTDVHHCLFNPGLSSFF
jgi:hypothetical protein